MAQGKTATVKAITNNVKTVLTDKLVELVVVNDQLVPEKNQVEPGVNSATNKN